MLGSKIDLFGNEWLDVVFDQKNKTYGAYALRRQSGSDTTKALLIAGTLFILFFLSPKIISLIKGNEVIDDPGNTTTVVAVAPPPAIDKKILPPVKIEPPKSKVSTVKFTVPIVVDNPAIEDPVMLKDLVNADPGQKKIAGDEEDGQIVITGQTGEGLKQAKIIEDDNNVYGVFTPLEVQPVFPGGMDKFYNYLSKSIRYPAMAQEIGLQGKVFVSFIIEKNGALSDIKVEKKLGSGTDEEAIRVLTASPKWIPGIQNGKPVRVRYNIPISFSLGQ
ncbi:energy transducer TonB [Pedobacter caeni]|uniref:Outer membrane transport energization protein TonB n=1 Tax=Pedobacter caeni TaxID=288992 RepID=A0A1M5A836_9SPHI|nr:energy transducer TonB [Pedobacter caeni]SHF26344.1 outer membrane transport energization protein TonB [Pedobacter caeni]